MEIWEEKYFKQTSDIKFKVNNNIYNLNKIIINISPYFRKLTGGNFMETNMEMIEINDIEESGWINFLKYIYTSYNNLYLTYYGTEIKSNFNIDILNLDEILSLFKVSNMFLVKNIMDETMSKIILYIRKYEMNNDYKNIEYLLSELYEYLPLKYSFLRRDIKYDLVKKSVIDDMHNYSQYPLLFYSNLVEMFLYDRYEYIIYIDKYNIESFGHILSHGDEDMDRAIFIALSIGISQDEINKIEENITENILQNPEDERYDVDEKTYEKNIELMRLLGKMSCNIVLKKLLLKYHDTMEFIYLNSIRIPGDDNIHNILENFQF